MIAPPVGGDSPFLRPHLLKLAAFLVSLVMASFATGLILALAGRTLALAVDVRYLAMLAATAGAIAMAGDALKAGKSCGTVFSSHWQVPRQWSAYGSPIYESVFGAILGVGFLTVVPFACFYLLVFWIACVGNPVHGALIMALFGVARSLPLVAISLSSSTRQITTATRRLSGVLTGPIPSTIRWSVSILALVELTAMIWLPSR